MVLKYLPRSPRLSDFTEASRWQFKKTGLDNFIEDLVRI